jgi:hypothetical protein
VPVWNTLSLIIIENRVHAKSNSPNRNEDKSTHYCTNRGGGGGVTGCDNFSHISCNLYTRIQAVKISVLCVVVSLKFLN